jgi:hypothetical protein
MKYKQNRKLVQITESTLIVGAANHSSPLGDVPPFAQASAGSSRHPPFLSSYHACPFPPSGSRFQSFEQTF